MTTFFTTRTRIATTVAAAAALAGGAAVATAAVVDPYIDGQGKYAACVASKDGSMRMVSPGTACRSGELKVDWNEKGPQGLPGATGATGPKGETGAKGEAGPAGPAGATGAQGERGLQGEVGPVGPQGEKGSPGEAGAQGPRGFTGYTGYTGATGATGPAGPEGAPGVSGYEVIGTTKKVGALEHVFLAADCPAGKKVLGGSAKFDGSAEIEDAPSWDGSGWWASIDGATLVGGTLKVYAICAKVG